MVLTFLPGFPLERAGVTVSGVYRAMSPFAAWKRPTGVGWVDPGASRGKTQRSSKRIEGRRSHDLTGGVGSALRL